MKKIKVLVLLAAFSCLNVFSQATHEISAHLGGGFSPITYKLSAGSKSGGFGTVFGLGYTYFFDYQLGIQTGVGLGLYNAQADLHDITTISSNLIDNEGDRFDMYTTLSGYKETQSAMYLNIPIMALYQIDMYYFSGGFKIGIPISGKYKSQDAILTNKGYYTEFDNWAETQEFAGYGTFRGRNIDGNIDFGIAVMLALEAGMKWFLKNDFMLYSGFYFDCGIINIKNKNQQFINYDPQNPEHFTTNSILDSYYNENESSKFVEKANLMSVGIMVRLSFGL